MSFGHYSILGTLKFKKINYRKYRNWTPYLIHRMGKRSILDTLFQSIQYYSEKHWQTPTQLLIFTITFANILEED